MLGNVRHESGGNEEVPQAFTRLKADPAMVASEAPADVRRSAEVAKQIDQLIAASIAQANREVPSPPESSTNLSLSSAFGSSGRAFFMPVRRCVDGRFSNKDSHFSIG